LTKAAKDSSSRLVAGFLRNFPQDSWVKSIVSGGKATFLSFGVKFTSASSRTLNVAERESYLIELFLLNSIYPSGPILVSRIGNVG